MQGSQTGQTRGRREGGGFRPHPFFALLMVHQSATGMVQTPFVVSLRAAGTVQTPAGTGQEPALRIYPACAYFHSKGPPPGDSLLMSLRLSRPTCPESIHPGTLSLFFSACSRAEEDDERTWQRREIQTSNHVSALSTLFTSHAKEPSIISGRGSCDFWRL